MSSGEASDEQLIDMIGHGDSEAVRILYERYGRLVFGVAVHIVGEEAAAEEVCQDVFLRVWEKSGTYRPDRGKVGTWLARIARNRAIDVLRSRRFRDPVNLSSEVEPDPRTEATTESPADALWKTFREREVREAVDGLPLAQKQALTLAFFKGLTHREIALALGEPLGTVKTRIRDAMVKLRSVLEREEGA
jgi:RNA polymerase sigma-70 factor (ECF subfamily)